MKEKKSRLNMIRKKSSMLNKLVTLPPLLTPTVVFTKAQKTIESTLKMKSKTQPTIFPGPITDTSRSKILLRTFTPDVANLPSSLSRESRSIMRLLTLLIYSDTNSLHGKTLACLLSLRSRKCQPTTDSLPILICSRTTLCKLSFLLVKMKM